MLNLQLARAFVDLAIETSKFDAGLSQVFARLNILKSQGIVNLRVDTSQAVAALNQVRRQMAAMGRASTVVIGGGSGGGAGGAGSAGQMVGLNRLQVNGLALQDRLIKAKEQAAAREAALQARSEAAQARAARQLASQQARAIQQQMTADERAAARAEALKQRTIDRDVASQARAARQLTAQQSKAVQQQMVADERAAARAVALQQQKAEREVAAQARAARQLASQQARAVQQNMAADERAAARAAALQQRMADRDAAQKARAARQLAAQQARATQQQMAAAEKDAARLEAIQDRMVQRDLRRRNQYEAKLQQAAIRAQEQGAAALRHSIGQGATGLAQGLGLGSLAMGPEMMAGQMIGSGLRDAVSTAMELQTTFLGIQRVTGESAANVDKFKATVFDIAKNQAGVSVKDVTDIAMAGGKAGITDKEGIAGLETFTRGMAKVRNSISGITTEQLSDDMIRMLNLFNKGTDYVQSFGSVLARMDNISTASASSILEMSKSLSGTFASLQMTIPQVMAFSSALADAGLTPQQGASSFSQILRMMASQSEKFANAAGADVGQFQEMMNTGRAMEALKLLTDKFKEINAIDPTKAQEWIAQLGFRGVRTAGAFQQLSTIMDKVAERTAMAEEEEKNLGSLISANALNSTTAAGNVQKLRNAFEELADAIGKVALEPMTQGVKDLLSLIKQMGGGKAGGPEALTFMETLELKARQAMMEVGGAIPNSPGFQERTNELKRKAEAYAAFQEDRPLSAGPAAEDEGQKKKEAIERPKRGAMLGRPKDDNPLALTVPGEGKAPTPWSMSNLTDVNAAMGDAGRRLAEAAAEAAKDPKFERNRKGLGFDEARRQSFGEFGVPGEGMPNPLIAPYKKGMAPQAEKEEAEKNAMYKKFADKAEEDAVKKKGFQSQTFSGGDDLARSFIQDALSKDKTPELQLDEQKEANRLLEDIIGKLTPKSGEKPNNNGPLIFNR